MITVTVYVHSNLHVTPLSLKVNEQKMRFIYFIIEVQTILKLDIKEMFTLLYLL